MEDQMLGNVLDHPIIIPPASNPRPCCQWTFGSLSEVLNDTKLSCRVWRKSSEQVLETTCDHVNVTMNDFTDWLQSSTNERNPLKNYDRFSHAAYIDYKYMKDVFSNCPENLEKVQWADFGLPDFDGKDSTIWIGSEGANTPGHQDSYGFNLVTQIAGRWLVSEFLHKHSGKSDAECLYPTRIPYEESSIFSQVHIGYPDTEKHPAVKNDGSYEDYEKAQSLTGDTDRSKMFIQLEYYTFWGSFTKENVPCYFNGYAITVQALRQLEDEPANQAMAVKDLLKSINEEKELQSIIPDDSSSHLTESLTRCLATSILPEIESNLYKQLLNPTETVCSQSQNLQFLKCAVEKVLEPLMPGTEKGCLQKHSEMDENINIKDNNIAGNAEVYDYLKDFGCWLKNCSILQAPRNPCLAFCGKHCETCSNLNGCIAQRSNFRVDSNSLALRGSLSNFDLDSTATRQLHDCIAECDSNCQDAYHKGNIVSVEKEITTRMRSNKLEQCNPPSKRFKHTENNRSSIITDGSCRCDRQQYFPAPKTVFSPSRNPADVTTVYSLAKSFSFHQYLQLMKVVEKTLVELDKSDHVDGAKLKGNLCHEENVMTSLKRCKNSTQSRAQNQKGNSDDMKCSGHTNHFISPSSSATSCSMPNPGVSHTDITNTTASSIAPSLSIMDVHKLLFESILHPSVVEQVARVFKTNCEHFLKAE